MKKMINICCPICGPDVGSSLLYPEKLPQGEASNFAARKSPDSYHHRIMKCDSCGLQFSNPFLDHSDIVSLYEESGFNYHDELHNLQETYGRCLERTFQFIPSKQRILEIGCGNGFFLEKALEMGFEEVVGVEPSRDALENARPEIRKHIRETIFDPNDFEPNSFDVVCYFQVIEHIVDVNGFLQGCLRCLKPGGVLLGVGHDTNALLARVLKDKSPIINDEHVYIFSNNTIQKIYQKNGFTIVDSGKVGNTYSWNYWIMMLPLPKILRRLIEGFMRGLKFGSKTMTIKAGNIFTIGQKQAVKNSELLQEGHVDEDVLSKAQKAVDVARRAVFDISHTTKIHHVGSMLSCIDIIAVLYDGFLNTSPDMVNDPQRDWFILSKGHAAVAWYIVLAQNGFFSIEQLSDLGTDSCNIGLHPDKDVLPGVEFSTGSLGNGFSVAIGVAFAAKIDNNPRKVYAMISDGECNEGIIWEAASFASHHKLNNIIGIVDNNGLQGFGRSKDVMNMNDIGKKFESFGWDVIEIDGHDVKHIVSAFESVSRQDRPIMIIANTVKGKGMGNLEDTLDSHYLSLDDEHYQHALDAMQIK